jgi:hypothetical protein
MASYCEGRGEIRPKAERPSAIYQPKEKIMANQNTLTVTACDNELIVLAYQWGASFELCRILSGNSHKVNVTLNIQSGQYTGPQVLNGVNNNLTATPDAYLSPGTYSLLLLGVDWGGPQQFTVDFNGTTYKLRYGTEGEGLVWNEGPIILTVPNG